MSIYFLGVSDETTGFSLQQKLLLKTHLFVKLYFLSKKGAKIIQKYNFNHERRNAVLLGEEGKKRVFDNWFRWISTVSQQENSFSLQEDECGSRLLMST